MRTYDNVHAVFEEHLADLYAPSALFMDGDQLLDHTYLGEILHQMVSEEAAEPFRERVASLVEDLHFNGDEGCKNLVHVSFFENMDNLSDAEVAVVRKALSPRMKRVMDEAFVELGYPAR